MRRRNLPIDYEPTEQEYRDYVYYIDHRGPQEPFYTYSGWLQAGNPEPKGLDKESKV